MALRYCKSIVKLLLLFCLNAGLLPDAVYGQDQMYWTSRFGRSIHRANLDGTGVENLITAVPVDPFGIDLDVASGKMYWTDRSSGTIQRANLDATGVETLVSGLIYVDGIALDVNGDKMYWTQFRPNMIRRANLDGSDVENLVHISNLASVPLGIALDVDGGKMYWIDAEAFAIWRANLDGTDVEAIVTVRGGADITLDVDGGKMYWTAPPFIVRANLDGSDLEILVRDLELPLNIALDECRLQYPYAKGKRPWRCHRSTALSQRQCNLNRR